MLRRPTHPFKRTIALLAVGGLLVLGPAALAHDDVVVDDGVMDNAEATHGHHSQHGGDEGHLPATSENVSVVGRGIINRGEGRIADVGVHNGFAYLTAFSEPRCQQGGVHVMDIRDVTAPQQVAFIPTSPGSYAGEGSQTIRIDTPSFTGDVLAFNNEICDATKKAANGGMTLVDVTNPLEPKRLAEHAGDHDSPAGPQADAHQIHSVFMWDAGAKAYAVIVDDDEAEDVDIMDITNPRKPVMVEEYDLARDFPQIVQSGVGLDGVFNHDMVVKEINGRQIMLVSYWDGGYVTLDVTDPARAKYVGDSDFAFPDSGAAEFGLSVDPEGNAHQAEFAGAADEYILAADEDFGPYRPKATNTSDRTSFTAVPGSGVPGFTPGEAFDFSTRYVGLACPGQTLQPAAVDEIAVIERGVCSFTEKVQAAEGAGYSAAIVFNREGSDGCSDLLTMLADAGIPAVFVGRDVGLGLFDQPYDEKACRAGSGLVPSSIPLDTVGDDVRFESIFDGWGYVHLFQNNSGKLQELDTYALPEAYDEDRASGNGDLSVHEVATSHADTRLAYISYYSGGLRVVRIGDDEQIHEVGRFIDEGGNNFWGVEVFEQGGKEYVAASDRDSGLYIFEYTGD